MKPGTSVMFEPASNYVLSYGLEWMWMMAWLICMSCDENAGKVCVTFVIELIHMAMPHSSQCKYHKICPIVTISCLNQGSYDTICDGWRIR